MEKSRTEQLRQMTILTQQGVIKGKLFVRDLLKLAKRLSRASGDSACVSVAVWSHPTIKGAEEQIEYRIWDSKWSSYQRVAMNGADNFDMREIALAVECVKGEVKKNDKEMRNRKGEK